MQLQSHFRLCRLYVISRVLSRSTHYTNNDNDNNDDDDDDDHDHDDDDDENDEDDLEDEDEDAEGTVVVAGDSLSLLASDALDGSSSSAAICMFW